MKLYYIYHSGFAIVGQTAIVIIDFWEDSIDALHGIIHNELLNQKEKKIYVLSTHFHPDHFNPETLTWRQAHPDIVYILSKDILRHKKATDKDGLFLKKGDIFDDGTLKVKAYGSTDSGDSFHIQLEGMSFFHAGDLNNWHWIDESTPQEAKKAEGDYLAELEDIKKDITDVDVTMFPVDRRMGTEYSKGARQFSEMIKSSIFVPMHFGNDYEGGNAFQQTAETQGASFLAINHRGQHWDLTELSK